MFKAACRPNLGLVAAVMGQISLFLCTGSLINGQYVVVRGNRGTTSAAADDSAHSQQCSEVLFMLHIALSDV